MKVGVVTGRVWSTKRHELLPPGALVRVEVDGGGSLIALDGLGVGIGDEALLVLGSVASHYCGSPVDAMVIGIVDPAGER
ncbi:EutN/CcmL family microcompartment protein [Hydrogenophaga sp.]|uniref:EutN/CcmL family microcompartment protein n=1 Tax=Hydrogenophaga sp. TaxID=1904254 RepID=UPI002CFC615C|nr:EutN/CcmL family microcompartment protein [Hydrogenophaga sp.]HMP09494.1 EutN/CcmL family microcompartment protein [Hydrogenophaga sp.]